MSLITKRFYTFGEFELRVSARLLSRNGTPVPLGSKAFDVLTCLVAHAGEVVTKDKLLRTVWPESFVEEGNLAQHVFALRKALGDRAGFIVTIPGRGYQFTPAVRQLDPDSPAPPDSGTFLLQRTRERTHVVIDETAHAAEAPGLPVGSWTYQESAHDSAAGAVRLGVVRSSLQVAVAEDIRNSGPELRTVVPTQPAVRDRRMPLWTGAIVAVVAAAGLLYLSRNARPPSAPVTVVLAEFDNNTGDAEFDSVLKEALAIDLDQSPFMNVMSDSEAVSILRLMGRPPATSLTSNLAREVCQRSNREVLIDGSVARLGSHFVLTLRATGCSSGRRVANAKSEAASKEEALAALDAAADKLRHALGESQQSLDRFQVPVAQASTSSFEALSQYSIGEYLLGRMGKEESDVLPFFQRSVELDPRFAMANAAVATALYTMGEYRMAAPYYQKAFDLSGEVSEKERLYIRAHYHADYLRDAEQGLQEYRLWSDVYPSDWGPWMDIGKTNIELGHYAEAIEAAQQAMNRDASRGAVYSTLAEAYLGANRFADAEATVNKAFSMGKNSITLHSILYQAALAQHDAAAATREIEWSHGKPGEWNLLRLQALAAASEGRFAHAQDLFDVAFASAQAGHLTHQANAVLVDQVRTAAYLGRTDIVRLTLARLQGRQADNPEVAYLEAALHPGAQGEHQLGGSGTLTSFVYKPMIRARLALDRADPSGALAALAPAARYEFAPGFDLLAERAEAYGKSERPELAVLQYRRILDHRGVDPTSPLYPLARLGLARAQAQQDLSRESRKEYEEFFAEWKDADPTSVPVLQNARREYLALSSAHQ